ncbi:ATP-dependent DNA helicase [Vibrio owensii]|uniref:ATP-dependent DNA helicase n=1 Tax=Vibrio harveyi group TaxID=717610 RepID=UPI003CC69D97
MNNKKQAKNKNRDIRMAQDFKKLNEGQQVAFLAARCGQNMFITGGGGVGKSFLINTLSKYLNGLVLLAPTGIAALNIEGQTIHSYFGFPHGYMEPHQAGKLKKHEKNKFKALKVLLIDEISMVRADLLDNIDAKLRNAKGSNRPFGGVQVIFVGDFCQLKPILNWKNQVEVSAISDRYGDNIYAFNSKVWRYNKITPYVLTDIKRTEESDYIRILRNLRLANKIKESVEEINYKAVGQKGPDSLYLCTTNKRVDEINMQRFNELQGDIHSFSGKTLGDFTDDKKPVPEVVDLKLNARVILCANGGEYVNGDIGTVKRFIDHNTIEVELDRGKTVQVTPHEWVSFKFDSKRDKFTDEFIVDKKEAGSYVQMPIKLAYALTIHKAQGQTLGSAHVDFGYKTFSAGQGYVALSRVRSLTTLSLERPVRVDDIKFDRAAVDYTMQCSIASIQRMDSDKIELELDKELKNADFMAKQKFEEIFDPKASISEKKVLKAKAQSLSRHLDSSIIEFADAMAKCEIIPIINVTATRRIISASFAHKGKKVTSTELFGMGFLSYLESRGIPCADLPEMWCDRLKELNEQGKASIKTEPKKKKSKTEGGYKPTSIAQKFVNGGLGF